MLLIDDSTKRVTLNHPMITALEKINMTDSGGTKIFEEVNKTIPGLLNTSNLNNLKKHLIPAGTIIKEIDILRILSLCEFTNQNLVCMYFDKTKSVFLPYQLVYKKNLTSPETVIKRIRFSF